MLNILNSFNTLKAYSLTAKVYVVYTFLSIFIASEVAASNPSHRAVWYRFYDQNGVANISSSVTPAHIKNGYEALDSNMQVIKKNRAYSTENDLRQSAVRAQQSKQKDSDLRLKKAYGSSQTAIKKKEDSLKIINKQMNLQKQQLKQIQKDRVLFKRQEMEFFRKGKPVPNELKDRLNYNIHNLTSTRNNIVKLQTDYRNTQSQYDTIIKRLKALE